ncbi:MAG: metallophosphoesterase [Lachnospiraceae bacterium]|nr:metallophosphoesterase [Lachnospiraceae bacterium]
MVLAVVSDIHANFKAFEAFLEYVKEHPVDGIIGLGDYITDSPYPQRTMGMLYQMMEDYPCYILRGNREEYMLSNREKDQGWKPYTSDGALFYTYENLTEKDLDFFESLSNTMELALPGVPPLTLVHGAPNESRGNFHLNPERRDPVLEEISTDYLIGGHSHHQQIYDNGKKMYVNVGALGMPIDRKGRHAEFAYLYGDEKGWRAELKSIPYDVEAQIKAFEESGLDEISLVLSKGIKKSLLTGKNYFIDAVNMAFEISGGAPIAELDRSIWEEIERKLEL